MTEVRAELTVEPFVEGELGAHVVAAIDALRAGGSEPDVGPFGTTVVGDSRQVGALVAGAIEAAFANGATGMTIVVHPAREVSTEGREFLRAVTPVLRALGVGVVDLGAAQADDLPLAWRGELVGAVRLPRGTEDSDLVHDSLTKLIARVESDFGGPLAELDRAGKQQAARALDELGAFRFRNAVDLVSVALGVSRATLYNYQQATRSRLG